MGNWLFIVLAMGLKPSPSGESFRFLQGASGLVLSGCAEHGRQTGLPLVRCGGQEANGCKDSGLLLCLRFLAGSSECR